MLSVHVLASAFIREGKYLFVLFNLDPGRFFENGEGGGHLMKRWTYFRGFTVIVYQ